jgi:RES domain-containing protein
VYAASNVATVDAEFERQLVRARLSSASVRPRELATIRVELRRVLDLREPAVRDALGVTTEDLMADDPSLAQTIGEAAQHLGYEAIVAPSAAGGPGHVVALFMTNRAPESTIEVVSVEEYVRQ